MHVERSGRGTRNFFAVHGWSGDHRTFQPLLTGIPEDVTFHAVDLPGCGQFATRQPLSLRSVVAEIVAEMRKVGEPLTLVGNCSGANLLLFAARQIPHQVERIVTIDAFAYWPWYFRIFLNPVFGRYAYFTTFANPLGRWFTNVSLRGKRAEDTSLVEGFERVDHASTYQYLKMLGAAGSADQFADLRMPIDVVYGEKSFRDVRRSAEIFAKQWPQATTHCLIGSGHLPLLEATAELQRLIFSSFRKGVSCSTNSTRYAD